MAHGVITITITVPVTSTSVANIDKIADLMKMKAHQVVEYINHVRPEDATIRLSKTVEG